MLASLRDFMKPVPGTALPRLGEQMLRGARVFAAFGLITAPLFAWTSSVPEGVDPARSCLVFGLLACGYASLLALSMTAFGRSRSSGLLLAVALCGIAGTLATGWAVDDGTNVLLSLVGLLPLAVAALVPWAPRYTLLLMVPVVAGPLVVTHAIGQQLLLPPELLGFMNLTIGGLAATASQVNRRMLAQLEHARSALVAADQLASLGQMTAGIAHELKTPIAAASNHATVAHTLLEELRASIGHPEVTTDDLREICGELLNTIGGMQRAVTRAGEFVHAVRSHTTNMNRNTCVPTRVSEVVRATATLLSHRLRNGSVELDLTAVRDDVVLHCDPGKLEQILTNLISNALDACENTGGKHRVVVGAQQRLDGVLLSVEDDGPGIEPQLAARIFQPFYTTRMNEGGTGLGLAICRELASGAFGGTLTLARTQPGARFELWCPRHGAAPLKAKTWVPALAAAR